MLVVEDPTLIAFGSVSDIATRVKASRPSVVRFATKLGFAGYSELQEWIRKGVIRQLAKPSVRVRQGSASRLSRQAVIDAATTAANALAEGRVARLAAPIANAQSVWIISGESSRAGAIVLLSGLSMIRPGVRLIEHHTLGRDLCHACERDVAVVFDFARYRRASVVAARAMIELGVPLVAITDSPLSPLASLTPDWCELKIPAVGPFDSSLPAVAAAEILVAEIVDQLGDAARERIDKLEDQWRATDTFFDQ
ncbi:MAG: MurR/RpiR family transcriptional regulator [Phycisphaerales bacterium]|nr:MurR/RpiR family transcriptional regulator [Phycisphaerales bacterium]MCB9835723.1 MurR/RpiR family transcriptional regulator [Phycisphaera sp.]